MTGLPRLSDAHWQGSYDRSAVRAGVVHLGLGAFHRAHQAPVFDDLIAGGDARWGIAGVAMRSPELVAALAAQDGLYSLSIRSDAAPPLRVIGAIGALHVAARDPEAVVAAIAGADTHLVTLTVTEKGYLDHGPNGPAGLIAQGLARRQATGQGPLTILSCDNRSDNGNFARDAVLAAAQVAELADATLRWIADTVTFPATMVDRITPAPTADMMAQSSAALGLRDDAAVWTEPFWQWVVEDRFAAARPALERVGVQMVADVAPWEKAKLRLLNAAHSALAYGGLLRGHVFVHQAVADPALRARIDALWEEAAVTLPPGAVDVAAYRAALLRRFSNAALPHALIQIAADGSQKIPVRILASVAERGARGLPSPALAAVFADWARALATVEGLADPHLAALRTAARGGGDRVPALLACIGIDPQVAYAGELARADVQGLA